MEADPAVELAAAKRKSKLRLPDVPAHDNLAALRDWFTRVLRLDREHPVTGAVHQGLRGPDGHVVIERADAPPIRFEPAAAMSTSRRLLPMLSWQLLKTDGELPSFTDEHARRIAHVTRLLCNARQEEREADETAGIVGFYMQDAKAVEGYTTYGTAGQTYEAAAVERQGGADLPG
jgi:hypothetical protein